MFGKIDHFTGAILVRIRRKLYSFLGKADASFIETNLAIGGVCDPDVLMKNGFNCILDMRKESKHNEKLMLQQGVDYLRIPVIDRKIPDMSDAHHAVEWIQKNIKENKKIFIHCNLGRGRGPMAACLYLITKNMSVNDAIKKIKKSRRYTYFNKDQIQFLHEFSHMMK